MSTADKGFRAADVTVVRPGITPREVSGPMAWWADGTTYVLRTTSDHVRGITIADEADTVLLVVDAIASGEPLSKEQLRLALRDVRRLRTRLDAVADELLLMAREAGEDGRSQLSFRDIAAETEQHFTTVAERHGRVARGEFADWRHWLVQHTAREGMYPTADGSPASAVGQSPAPLPKGKNVRCDVFDAPGTPGKVHAVCLADECGWTSRPMRNVVTASMVGRLHAASPHDPMRRSDTNLYGADVPSTEPACEAEHPDGDTVCCRPADHDTGAPRTGPHQDVLGRTWPVQCAETLTGRPVTGADCETCGEPIESGRAMSAPGGGWAHETCPADATAK